jgi:hypothetical protein
MEAALSERLDARRYLGPLGFATSFCEGRATNRPLDLMAGAWHRHHTAALLSSMNSPSMTT